MPGFTNVELRKEEDINGLGRRIKRSLSVSDGDEPATPRKAVKTGTLDHPQSHSPGRNGTSLETKSDLTPPAAKAKLKSAFKTVSLKKASVCVTWADQKAPSILTDTETPAATTKLTESGSEDSEEEDSDEKDSDALERDFKIEQLEREKDRLKKRIKADLKTLEKVEVELEIKQLEQERDQLLKRMTTDRERVGMIKVKLCILRDDSE